MIAKDTVRYLVEHRLIPHSIYTNGLALSFSLMTAPGDTMAQFFQDAALIAAGAISVTPLMIFQSHIKLLKRKMTGC